MLEKMLEQEYGQMMEMAGDSYVIAMTSVADSREAFEALYQAIETIDGQLTHFETISDNILYNRIPERNMEITEAKNKEIEEVSFAEAVGRISGEYVYIYPPGIPIVTPGELFSEEILNEIKKAVDKGFHVRGVLTKEELYVNVVTVQGKREKVPIRKRLRYKNKR